MSIAEFNPDSWLLSLHRGLDDFVKIRINEYVRNNVNAPAGLQAFEVVMDWPEADDLIKQIQLEKTVIHFVADDIDSQGLGFGTNVVAGTEQLQISPLPDYVGWQQAKMHTVNYDVGVWASDKSGGSSMRLFAYQMLDQIFGGDYARRDLRTATQGVEIVSYSGGSFITEKINDVRVYRIIDCELIVRVFSRFMLKDQVIVEDVVQAPDLEIDNLPIS